MSMDEHNDPIERTPVPMPARWSDPHLQPAAQHPESVERYIAALFFAGMVAFAAFGAAFWQNWAPWALGLTLGMGMLLMGIGITAWGKYLMPRGPFVEDRHELASGKETVEAFTNALVERGAAPVQRRKVLGGLLGSGLGIFGIVAMFPLLRSLGPLPGNSLSKTDWKSGVYLVDQQGNRISQYALAIGSIATVFPEGFENSESGQAVDQVVLIHLAPGNIKHMPPGRGTWTPNSYVAYSKVCTHAGCPVGLYERELKLLVCPCHQSMFNVCDGAFPIFGPAPRPLPQLPLAIDADGFLYAQAGFDQPVGPGYWSRA
jgi:ubiquinol-cytochrome c reductase iron-sulfur subunit